MEQTSCVPSSQEVSAPLVPKEYKSSFYLLVTCFALWGAVNSMAEVLVKAFESVFPELSNMGTVMTVTSHYGAYAVLAIPTSIFIKKYSYKAGVLLGLGVFFTGVLGYVPAACLYNYDICLASIFVYASGCSILETTCNPFVLALGPAETSVRRLNFAQQFNPVGCLIGLCVARFAIFENMKQGTPENPLTMAEQQANLISLVTPYMVLAVIVLLLWIAFKFKHIPNVSVQGEEEETERTFGASLGRLLRLPRYRWGVATQFFYVGLQTMAWIYVLHYAGKICGYDDKDSMWFYIAAMGCFIVFRFICTALMKKYNPADMMSIAAVIGIALCLGAVYLPNMAGLLCVVAISACLSLMFPTIYGIALRGLGGDSKLGAAGLVMSILGGAAVPPVFAYCLDHGTLSFLTFDMFSAEDAALRSGYFVLLVCLVIVLAYSLRFRDTSEQAYEKSSKN